MQPPSQIASNSTYMFELVAIPAPDSENVWLPTFHDLDDRIIRVVTLLKNTRLKTHEFLHQRRHASAETALRPGRKRGGNPKNHGVTCKAVPVWDGKMTNFQGMFGKIVILAWELRWECFQGVLRLQFSKPSRNVRVLFRLMEVSTFFWMA